VQQCGQRGRAGLLLALDEQRHPHGRAAAERAQHRQVGHHPGLVVGGAAAVQPSVALGGFERRARPVLVATRGLHVVVRVEQHGGCAGRAGEACDDGGCAAVRRDGRDVGGAGTPRELGDGLRAAAGVVGMGRIGPDAGDAHQAFEVGAGVREGGGHGRSDGLLRHVPGS
jgi:hypothetical protein